MRKRLNYKKDFNGPRIALPSVEHCQTWDDCSQWKNLPDDEFMEIYGNKVLAIYWVPTEEEVDQYEAWEEEARITREEAEVRRAMGRERPENPYSPINDNDDDNDNDNDNDNDIYV